MRHLSITLALAAALLFAAAATAQEKYVPRVSFKLVVIHASGSQGEVDIDDKLADLKEALTATGHKKFKFVKSRDYSYPEWTPIGEPLGDGYQLTMVTRWLQNQTPGVKVSVTHKRDKRTPIIQVIVPLKKGKPALVDGPKVANGVLLLCFIGQ